MFLLALIVKLVPADLFVITYVRPPAVLQVTPNLESRDESSITNIWLLAVTAEVLTVKVSPPVAIDTLPATEEPQVAGEADELQFDVLLMVEVFIPPMIVVVTPERPILIEVAVDEPIDNRPGVNVSIPRPSASILIKLAKNPPFTDKSAIGLVVDIPTLLFIITF